MISRGYLQLEIYLDPHSVPNWYESNIKNAICSADDIRDWSPWFQFAQNVKKYLYKTS